MRIYSDASAFSDAIAQASGRPASSALLDATVTVLRARAWKTLRRATFLARVPSAGAVKEASVGVAACAAGLASRRHGSFCGGAAVRQPLGHA